MFDASCLPFDVRCFLVVGCCLLFGVCLMFDV